MPDWTEKDSSLVKEFTFTDFQTALNFVNKVGELAEQMQHHPDIFLHGYKNVRITTSTHDAGQVTEKDHTLAEKIDQL